MTNLHDIPQYSLLDSAGNPVHFHLLQFGNTSQNYNYEKPHRHNFYELLVFNKGGGTHDIDFTTYKANNHSIHFVAAENVHMVLRGESSSGCILLFSADFINKELIQQLPFSKTNPILKLNKRDFILINQLIESIRLEHETKQTAYEAIIQAHMHTLMLYLLRMYNKQCPESQEKNIKPESITHFMELIKAHYMDHYKVEQYAAHLNISPKHLITLCKTHTGKTPLQHIRDYTIMEAKKLLFHTRLTVKEIAYQLHFDEPANFSKYFKAATSYTPLAYREGIK